MFSWFGTKKAPEPSIEEYLIKLEAKRLEREIALQEAILERKNAYQMAIGRHRLLYLISGGVLTMFIAGFSALRYSNLLHATVIPPIISLLAYEGNTYYGTNFKQIQKTAQKIFEESNIILSLRPISVEELDARILDSHLV